MTMAQKRIAIAKDVIKRIEANQYRPQSDVFCLIGGYNISELKRAEEDQEVCDIVNSDKQCTVCAKGGLFMSYIGYTNNFTVRKLSNSPSSQSNLEYNEMQALSKIFSPKQLSLIETSFERKTFDWNRNLTETEKNKCYSWHRRFFDSSKRLVGIMKNIIKNKGIFKP